MRRHRCRPPRGPHARRHVHGPSSGATRPGTVTWAGRTPDASRPFRRPDFRLWRVGTRLRREWRRAVVGNRPTRKLMDLIGLEAIGRLSSDGSDGWKRILRGPRARSAGTDTDDSRGASPVADPPAKGNQPSEPSDDRCRFGRKLRIWLLLRVGRLPVRRFSIGVNCRPTSIEIGCDPPAGQSGGEWGGPAVGLG